MTLLHPSAQVQELYPIGSIIEATCPPNENWLKCEGQLLSRSGYSELLSALETDNPYPWVKQSVDLALPTQFASTGMFGLANNGNRYVGVCYSGVSAYTDDGETWTYVALPNTGDYSDIAYNGSVFFTMEYNSVNAATSTNGASWTARTLPDSYDWECVCWDGTYFILGANDYNTCLRSTDGITWNTSGTFPTAIGSVGPHMIRSNGSGLTVAMNSAGAVWISEDSGANWTWTIVLPKSPFSTFSTWKLSYANGYFFAPCYQWAGLSYYSTDGIEWKTAWFTTFENIGGEAYSNFSPREMNASVHRWYYFKDQWFGLPNSSNFGVRSPDMKRFYPWMINLSMCGSGTEAAGYNTTSGKIFICDAWYRYVTYAEEYAFDESNYFQLPKRHMNQKGVLGLYNFIRAK